MKITKKLIVSTLRTLDRTAIYKVAKLSGVDITEKINVHDFIKEFAPSIKVSKQAYNIAFNKTLPQWWFERSPIGRYESKVGKVLAFAKMQKKERQNSYLKILIEGNSNIYWASPLYQHQDYNKSIALPNTEKNREVMRVVNNFLTKKS